MTHYYNTDKKNLDERDRKRQYDSRYKNKDLHDPEHNKSYYKPQRNERDFIEKPDTSDYDRYSRERIYQPPNTNLHERDRYIERDGIINERYMMDYRRRPGYMAREGDDYFSNSYDSIRNGPYRYDSRHPGDHRRRNRIFYDPRKRINYSVSSQGVYMGNGKSEYDNRYEGSEMNSYPRNNYTYARRPGSRYDSDMDIRGREYNSDSDFRVREFSESNYNRKYAEPIDNAFSKFEESVMDNTFNSYANRGYPQEDKSEYYNFGDNCSRYGNERFAREEELPKPSESLGLFNLSPFTTEDDIRDLVKETLPNSFNYFIKLMVDQKTGLCRGYSFINFNTIEESTNAKKLLKGKSIKGAVIKTNYGKSLN